MLIVGPAIFELSDPTNMGVSVFTQTMDALLPAPLPLLGTLVGVLVLMSASAASAQGLQNLALGLKERRYVPPVIGQPNDYEVADKPVWIEVGIVSVVFFFFGTHEETYLALYAAGVFVLLSMTGWAVTKRLLRDIREDFSPQKAGLLTGTIFASLLTTGATAIIFEERFLEGAWTYFLFIPALYIVFTYFRSRLGAPSPEMEYLGRFNAAQLAGFGFGQAASEAAPGGNGAGGEFTWQPEPIEHSHWREDQVEIERMLVLLDGSDYAAQALPYAKLFSKATGARITLLSAVKDYTPALQEEFKQTATQRKAYLKKTAAALKKAGFQVDYVVRPGFIADAAAQFAEEQGIDIIVISLRGKSGADNWQRGGATQKLVHKTDKPVLLVQATDPGLNDKLPNIERILVPLDGSILSEQALPYSRNLSKALESELILLTVPVVPSSESYRAAGQVVEAIREKAEENMREFLDAVAGSLQSDGVKARALVTGSMPARTIVTVSDEEDVDLILMTSQGRGGLDLLLTGSVAGRVVQQTNVAVMIVPIIEDPNGS
jgi:nucleotide-binding universal stress UspA family protein